VNVLSLEQRGYYAILNLGDEMDAPK
jgi:hypothetical protein